MSLIKQVCSFYLGQQMYGVDVQLVQEVIRYQEMTSVPLAPDAVVGLINLRGQIVTAVDMRKRLGLPCRGEDEYPLNVIVQGVDGAVSMLVDKIGDVQDIEDASIEPPPETVSPLWKSMIRGAYKMQSNLLLILDAERALNVQAVAQ